MARHQSNRYDVVCSVINEIFGKYASQVECVTEIEHFEEAVLKDVAISDTADEVKCCNTRAGCGCNHFDKMINKVGLKPSSAGE